MKRINVNIKIFVFYAIAVASIGYFLFTTYKNVCKSYSENKNVNYDQEIISDANNILVDIKDIETIYSGFIINPDDKYIESFNTTIEKTTTDLQALDKLTVSDTEKSNAVQSLNENINEKITIARKIIALCKQNKKNEAKDLSTSEQPVVIMDNIHKILSGLTSDASQDLKESSIKKQSLDSVTRNDFLVLSVIILIGLIIFYIVTASDFRKNEKAKTDLLTAGEKIRNLYDDAPSGYISVDDNLKILQINKTALSWLDYSFDEIAGKKSLSELVNSRSATMLQRLRENESIANLEIELTGKKNILPVIMDAVTQRNPDGSFAEKRVMLTNITQRKKAEEQNHYLATLIDQSSDAIFSTDTEFRIRSWNKGAERMYGFNETEVLNKDASIINLNTSKDERIIIKQVLDEKGYWKGERLQTKKDGTLFPVYSSISSLYDEDKILTGYVSVVQDITTRKLYEEKLKNFNNELIEKVEEKTQELVNIFERVTDGFLSIDKDYKITYINTVGAKLLNSEKSELLGKDLTMQFSKEDNSIRRAYKKAFETQQRIEIEDYYKFLNKWYYGVMYPNPEGVSIFFRDVTSRKEAELKMIESEKQYRLLFENNPLPMWILSLSSSKILDVNNAAIRHYGYDKAEFTGMKILDLFPAEESQRYLDYNKSHVPRQENGGTWTHIKKDGSEIKVEILSYDTNYYGRDCRLIISNDITDKIKYEEELRNSRDQLRQLSVHLEKIRDEERAAIAREVHDELGQQLTGIKMDISWLSKKISDGPEGVKEKISATLQLIDDTVKSVRKIASELRPVVLDDLGLNEALDWQTHEFIKHTGIKCNFKSELSENLIDKNISTGVFRILQEALTNVARHSNATEVNCHLSNDDKEINMIISDNGTGIKETGIKEKTLGILGMRERAFMMNGTLTIESLPGKGTKLHLVVPLNKIE